MRVLGICHDVLICSACLLEDGKIVAAMAEERLDRQKMSRVFPVRAIDACLAQAGLSIEDVDEVAIAWNPGIDLETAPHGYVAGRRWRIEHLLQVPARMMRLAGAKAAPYHTHRDLFPGAPPITYLDHYLAHVGNALYLSPFEQNPGEPCAVLVMDGHGERSSCLLARADGVEIETLEQVDYPHSLGHFYGTVTEFLGYRPDSDEWKVMAMASYGNRGEDNPYLEKMRRLVRVDERGRLELALEFFDFYTIFQPRHYSPRYLDLFGEPREPGSEITDRHNDIAAAAQVVFEETMHSILTTLHTRTGTDRLVVSGGCFMNSVYNGKITSTTPFREVAISSCPDDSGTAVGAALYLHALRTGKRPPVAPQHNYWGLGFSDAKCLEVARGYKLPTEVVEDPSDRAAEDLANGLLVGWFQGRAEFGQRALGNRSILADPRRAEAKDIVNAAVKYREAFRPFAPAILAERVQEYFDCEPGTRVPFMERVLPFLDDKKAEVPAVVHVDGSGRLQTVDLESSPRYHALVRAFAERTGVPVVLNTSFNLNGEPIVNSPTDAVRTFFSCGLDVLYLGNVRIAKGDLG